ncbi:MAG: UDP-N-acetylmuramoyl-L-alanyl-D-glutamate--2,6-diaminopimelate ligase [Bacillaceae bacterium G1]|nr:MAG: UDP-N-acetylmuramoyl-L-alanyl-D-glutamate--2,6-diaminopimelate ligase [Bacillaceae bacterium G1]
MLLADIQRWLITAEIRGEASTAVHGIAADSRRVKPGDLFICLPGFTVDGHDFAEQAVQKGACALLVERFLPLAVPQLRVTDTRRAMAIIADRFFRQPTQQLRLIGVTGTNGKTTVTYLLEKIFSDAGHKTGLIGTIRHKVGDTWIPSHNTTPDALDLQQMFRQMVDAGADYAVMEVSSHALQLGRVRGCFFRTAVFTNLSRDHLDFHGTMEEYLWAKSLLFSGLGNSYGDVTQFAVLNADDPAADRLAQVTAQPVVTYGVRKPADVKALKMELRPDGTVVDVETFHGAIRLRLQLVGLFNVYNALAAMTVALLEGLDLEQIGASLEQVTGVPGRFERIDEGGDIHVIVDYAHTPDSLQNVLQAIRGFSPGRIICVVGCGGDRDRGKRPLMAQVAVEYSDLAVFTSDNPRSEDPERILADMAAGVLNQSGRWISIVDRREAIFEAIRRAKAGDTVLIAGKGHETYQIVGQQTLPFDDREVARLALQERRKSGER